MGSPEMRHTPLLSRNPTKRHTLSKDRFHTRSPSRLPTRKPTTSPRRFHTLSPNRSHTPSPSRSHTPSPRRLHTRKVTMSRQRSHTPSPSRFQRPPMRLSHTRLPSRSQLRSQDKLRELSRSRRLTPTLTSSTMATVTTEAQAALPPAMAMDTEQLPIKTELILSTVCLTRAPVSLDEVP